MNTFRFLLNNYLNRHGVIHAIEIRNKNARMDWLITSATTDNIHDVAVGVEVKNKDTWVWAYKSGFIEQQKYCSLQSLSKNIDGPMLYCLIFEDAYLIWQLNFRKRYEEGIEVYPKYHGSTEMKEVPVFYLPYEEADFIIGGSTTQRRTYAELCDYIMKQKEKHALKTILDQTP